MTDEHATHLGADAMPQPGPWDCTALGPDQTRRIFLLAKEATQSNNPLVYRDALERIARLAAFGTERR